MFSFASLPFLRDRRGNTTVIFALCMPAMVGFAGLGVEAGYWQYKQRQMQTAADMAAYAGAVSLRNRESDDQAHGEARVEADRHGFDGARGAFTANTPPLAGGFRNNRSVEVTLTHDAERFFSRIFTEAPVMFEVRAVATYYEGADACILSLSPDDGASMEFFGSSDIDLIECEVMSNSIAPDAVSIRGSTEVSAPCINSVGGYEISGGGSDIDLTDCRAPRTNLPRAADPFADIEPPEMPSSCSNLNGGNPHSTTTVTAGAGGVRRFCNGLNLTNDVVFEPGVYVIDGGRFRIGANANVFGEGVTFYLTGGAEVDMNGGAEVDLSAPTSGEYSGLVFMGDRNDYDVEHKFNGTVTSRITGSIYMPAGNIDFLGNFSGDNGCMFLVGHTVSLGGNANITTDCSGLGMSWAEVPSDVRLVE